MNTSILIIPAVFLVAMVAIFGWRKAPGIFLGIMAACAVIYATAAIVHAWTYERKTNKHLPMLRRDQAFVPSQDRWRAGVVQRRLQALLDGNGRTGPLDVLSLSQMN
jgi:hypothetical protein